MVESFRVGYANGAEGVFLPVPGRFDIDIHGTEGLVTAWDNGESFRIRRGDRRSNQISEQTIRPAGEGPTVCTIRNVIREMETGEKTDGNIEVTMQAVEVQFGLAHSHLNNGQRIDLPLTDRTLYIPGG